MNEISLKWYVVNTYSGCESTARNALLERIERNAVSHLIPEVCVPTTTVEKFSDSGKKKRQEKTLYPGYILVKMAYNLDTRRIVTGTPKVNGFVGDSKYPKPISEQEVLRLTTSTKGLSDQTEVKVSFEKGEVVKIKEGPFANFNGTIGEVRADKMILRILVSVFGRETPVEIEFDQVEKLS